MGCGCKSTSVDNSVPGKLKSILTGWKNIVWSSPQVKEIARKRAEICSLCEKNVKNICLDCGCFLPAKARSLDEHCHKWDEIDRQYGL